MVLSSLFAPSSIAVIGASGRVGRPGHQVLACCRRIGFDGPVYPITPTYDKVLGWDCLPDVGSLPEPVDLAILAGASQRMESHAEKALASGARSLAIFGNATPAAPVEPTLLQRMTALAREAQVPLLGPATLGYVNWAERCAGSWIVPKPTEAGGIAIIAQSGTIYCEANMGDSRLRLSFSAHSGQEATLTLADMLKFALAMPSTRVVGLYLEVVRDVGGLVEGLELALERDVPIVAMRPGRTPRSRSQIATHAASMAGSDASFRALFRRYGVESATSSDEWWATVALLGAGCRPGPGGLAAMTDSGGERALLLDHAEELSVPLAKVSRDTQRQLTTVLSPNVCAENPLDFWDGESDLRTHAEACLRPLVADDATAMAVVFCDFGAHDPDPDGFAASLADVVRSVGGSTAKPVVAGTYTSRQTRPDLMLELARNGTPTLDGMRNALLAVGHAFAYRDMRERLDALSTPPTVDRVAVQRWRARLRSGSTLLETEALAMLRDFDLPTIAGEEVDSERAAIAAAGRLGGTVVLKTNEGIAHKSEHRGVHVGLRTHDTVAAAYRDVAGRLGPRALVAAMAPAGVEAAVGVIVDQFGPIVMVATGGTLAEMIADRCFLMAPVSVDEVERAIGELRLARLLAGTRGSPACDVASLCEYVSRLSVLAYELRDILAEVDVNPVVVHERGCVAVDAMVVPQDRVSQRGATR